MPNSESSRLLVSIHDVGPRFEREIDILVERLERQIGAGKFAMLVVPDHWGEHPIATNLPYQARLRSYADSGAEIFVHGWFHRDFAEHSGSARLRAKYMTASEGEFLGLTVAEAAKRMAGGRALIEDVIGREVAGFIAPAWLYGSGAREALAISGFALAEDHMRVWQPETGKVVARGPVITWASRSPARTASSLAFATLACVALQMLPTVRIAVHPGDVTKESILRSIDLTVESFLKKRQASPGPQAQLSGNPLLDTDRQVRNTVDDALPVSLFVV